MTSMLQLPALLFAAALGVLGLCGCKQKPASLPQAQDGRVQEIIQRATASPGALQHARIEMNLVEVTRVPAGQAPLSTLEDRRLARFGRAVQPDGSSLYTHRTHGIFEFRTPQLAWIRLQTSGSGENAILVLSDEQSTYVFNSRDADSISRLPPQAIASVAGPAATALIGAALTEETRQATSVRLREREVLNGEMCDVVALTIPVNKDDSQSGEREVVHYIAVSDGLIRRSTEARGPLGRRSFSETTLNIDRAFVPEEINYARFEKEVMSLLQDKAMPPVVARME